MRLLKSSCINCVPVNLGKISRYIYTLNTDSFGLLPFAP